MLFCLLRNVFKLISTSDGCTGGLEGEESDYIFFFNCAKSTTFVRILAAGVRSSVETSSLWDDTVLLCLYVADPATFLASNSVLGSLFYLRSTCLYSFALLPH